jgi:hypothetical protein
VLPRRKVSELSARYKLEPNLNDIFVEGDQDKRILDKAYKHKGEHRPVYSVSAIEIPVGLLLKWDLTDGNRQRALALRNELALPDGSAVRFLIDSDLDQHLGRQIAHCLTVYTKYTDIEGAFLFEDLIHDLVVNAGRSKISDWSKFFSSLECAVKKMFSLRLALEEGSYRIMIPSWTKSLSRKGDEIAFDIDELINKLGSSGLKPKQISDVRSAASKWNGKLEAFEARAAGRGHDYIDILSWAIKNFGGNSNIAATLDNLLVLLVPQVADDIVDTIA